MDDEVLTDSWIVRTIDRVMAGLEELSAPFIIGLSLVALGVLVQAWVRGSF